MGCGDSKPTALVGNPHTHGPLKQFDANDRVQERAYKNQRDIVNVVDDLIGHKYRVEGWLGSGAYACTYACRDKKGHKFAAKIMDNRVLANNPHEVKVHDLVLDIPNAINTHEIVVGDSMTALILERANGGEYFDRIKDNGYIAEDDVRILIRELLRTVHAIHERGFLHRNIQPENILMLSKTNNVSFRLAGYHTAHPHEGARDRSGAPYYVAPEVLGSAGHGIAPAYCKSMDGKGDDQGEARYGRPSDVYSIGCVAFVALCGWPAFYKDNFKDVFEHDPAFGDEPWGTVLSADAEDFVGSILKATAPDKRPTIPELLDHKWMQGAGIPQVVEAVMVATPLSGTPPGSPKGPRPGEPPAGTPPAAQPMAPPPPVAPAMAAPAWWQAPQATQMMQQQMMTTTTVTTTTTTTMCMAAVTIPMGAMYGQPLQIARPDGNGMATVAVPQGYQPGMQFQASLPMATPAAGGVQVRRIAVHKVSRRARAAASRARAAPAAAAPPRPRPAKAAGTR